MAKVYGFNRGPIGRFAMFSINGYLYEAWYDGQFIFVKDITCQDY